MVIKLGGLDSEVTVPFNQCQYLPDVSKIRKLSAPKPEKRSPKNQQGSGVTLGVLGYPN